MFKQCAVEFKAPRYFLGVVYGLRLGHIEDGLATLPDSNAKIDIFGRIEKALIQQANFIEQLAAKKPESGDSVVNCACM